jgi:hypothetical protein
VHLNNDDLDADDLAYLEIPTDEEAAESTVEQRVSFETQRRDKFARHLMAAERMASTDRLAAAQQMVHQSAYLRNMTAQARAAAGRRLQEEERARAAVLAGRASTNTLSPPTPTLAS